MSRVTERRRIAIAITGASGVQYSFRLLQCLLAADVRVHLMVSKPAQVVIGMDTDIRLPARAADMREFLLGECGGEAGELDVYGQDQWTAPVASGSGVPEAYDIPLFLLDTVLFPGGDLPLRVFEARYTDMVANSMREETPFAIGAIAEGREVGDAATPCDVVTEASVIDWEAGDAGSLRIVVRGTRKLRVLSSRVQDDKLVLGTVTPIAEEATVAVPAVHADTVALLRDVLDKTREWPTGPHAWRDDAAWIGARLVERLPLNLAGKQHLLEMEDPIERLRALAHVTTVMRA